MVEMLSDVDASNAMSLAELRLLMANTTELSTAGDGIDVALIDTGVAPVRGLDGPDEVLHGPDLSVECSG